MTTVNKLLIAGLLFGFSSTPAIAQSADGTGIFFGGSVGYVNLDENSGPADDQITAAGFTGMVDVDDTDMGWKAFAGYNFSRYFGLEFGYVDLGDAKTEVNLTAPGAAVSSAQSRTEISGYTVTAIVRYPFTDKFEMFGKFGGLFSDVDHTTTGTGSALTLVVPTADEGDENITAGLGMKYMVSDHIGVRAEWDRYMDVSFGDNNVDMWSMGLEFSY